jgi:hypothetical protein
MLKSLYNSYFVVIQLQGLKFIEVGDIAYFADFVACERKVDQFYLVAQVCHVLDVVVGWVNRNVQRESSVRRSLSKILGTAVRFRPSIDKILSSVSIDRSGRVTGFVLPMYSFVSFLRVCTTERSVRGFSLIMSVSKFELPLISSKLSIWFPSK